ncbi:hypothetical protein [Shewanella ulleungensis]|uniref:hypothetical protein n=1 Tax=Shewanella ulleungensis TaxID=2282699 RepID=UPI003D7BC739
MGDSIIMVGIYLVRFAMSMVAGYICYMWGYGIDNSIFTMLTYFLLLTVISFEASSCDGYSMVYKIYGVTFTGLIASYFILMLLFGLVEIGNAIPGGH